MRCLQCRTDGLALDLIICTTCGVHIPSAHRDVLPHGTLLSWDKYRIDYPLGRGGFGITYRAVHRELENVVAIKEFFPQAHAVRDGTTGGLLLPPRERDSFSRSLERFAREGRILVQLNHPGVVRVSDLFQERGTAYLVMDLISGATLRDELDRQKDGRLSEDRVKTILDQMVPALEAIHARGVYHLDLKPDNLVLTPDGRAVLIDFGAARQGLGAGTVQAFTYEYAAPEVLARKEVGPQSDLFELGMMLHEMLTGAPPPAAMERLCTDGWKVGSLSEPWRTLVEQACRMDMETRPESIRTWWNDRFPRGDAGDSSPVKSSPHDLLDHAGELERLTELSRDITESIKRASEDSRAAAAKAWEETEAKRRPAKRSSGETSINSRDGAEMVFVPAGQFTMGSSDGGDDVKPERRVTISRGYWIYSTPVTNEQYGRYLTANPGAAKPRHWTDARFNNPRQPVVGVSWNDAAAYCAWARARLPTEAEWEYAARGADGRIHPWGNEPPDASRALFGQQYSTGRPGCVGERQAGASWCGALDMAGNVAEWCADWYNEEYYSYAPEQDPPGPAAGLCRVLRGGAWNFYANYLRASNRGGVEPGNRVNGIGFRAARTGL